MWLTVPLNYKFGELIKDVKIDNSKPWQKKHWNSIIANYSKAPYFNQYKSIFEEFYTKKWESLSELNTALIKKIAEILGIKTKIVLASEIIDLTSKGPEALLDICKTLKATTYISGKDGEKYISEEMKKKFKDAKIKIVFQDYKHPEYKQNYPEFEPYMCILDLIFNYGPNSLKIISENQQK